MNLLRDSKQTIFLKMALLESAFRRAKFCEILRYVIYVILFVQMLTDA